jgi:UDPglucose 6-dehydrogenase
MIEETKLAHEAPRSVEVLRTQGQECVPDSARVALCGQAYEAVAGGDALVVVTEWNDLREPDFAKTKALMRHSAIFDGRNICGPRVRRDLGFHYDGSGRR